MKKFNKKKVWMFLLGTVMSFNVNAKGTFSLTDTVKPILNASGGAVSSLVKASKLPGDSNKSVFSRYRFEYKKDGIHVTDRKTKKKKIYKRGSRISQGIDVSKWQAKIDWKKVSGVKDKKTKEREIKFAIIREGYGIDIPKQKDPYFKRNIEEAQKNGIKCGAYHYSYATNEKEAEQEAEFCLKNIKGYKFEYPIVFDIEEGKVAKLGKKKVAGICRAFCKKLADNNYYPAVYSCLYWVENYIDSDKLFKECDLWLARYMKVHSDDPGYNCGIWQWTSSGRIDGIDSCVDRCKSYYDYPEIIKEYHLNGW